MNIDNESRKRFETKKAKELELLHALIKEHFPEANTGAFLGRGAYSVIIDGKDRVYKVIFNHIDRNYHPENGLLDLPKEHRSVIENEINMYQRPELNGVIPKLLSPPIRTEKFAILETEKVDQSTLFYKLPKFIKKFLIRKISKKLIEAQVIPRIDTEIVWDKRKKRAVILDLGSLTHAPNVSLEELTLAISKELESV